MSHVVHDAASPQSSAVQITPHAAGAPVCVVVAPHTIDFDHPFVPGISCPPATARLPQMIWVPQSGDDGYAPIGAAKKRARSTAPFAFRKPEPSVSGSYCG